MYVCIMTCGLSRTWSYVLFGGEKLWPDTYEHKRAPLVETHFRGAIYCSFWYVWSEDMRRETLVELDKKFGQWQLLVRGFPTESLGTKPTRHQFTHDNAINPVMIVRKRKHHKKFDFLRRWRLCFNFFLLCAYIMLINIKMIFFFCIEKTETLEESTELIALLQRSSRVRPKGWSSMETKA